MANRLLLILVCLTVAQPLSVHRARAGSEDDCIDAQQRLKDAKDEASEAAHSYASCVEEHDNADDCSSEKSALDEAHEEVEDATMMASTDCM